MKLIPIITIKGDKSYFNPKHVSAIYVRDNQTEIYFSGGGLLYIYTYEPIENVLAAINSK